MRGSCLDGRETLVIAPQRPGCGHVSGLQGMETPPKEGPLASAAVRKSRNADAWCADIVSA